MLVVKKMTESSGIHPEKCQTLRFLIADVFAIIKDGSFETLFNKKMATIF
jgi:hypothetical protein